MAENSKIEWTDHTFNPWRGCTKVSPGCENCYAETLAKRNPRLLGEWGPGKPRVLASDDMWQQPLKWNRHAELAWENWKTAVVARAGDSGPMPQRPRVFCASLADWLDDEVPVVWLARLLVLIMSTPELDWLLLTKRPQNFNGRMDAALKCILKATGGEPCNEADFIDGWVNKRDMIPENIWIGTTVEDQRRADERIPALLKIPARVRFLSCEPLLGYVSLYDALKTCARWPAKYGHWTEAPYSEIQWSIQSLVSVNWRNGIHWVICGGESGPGARPMNPDWARCLRDQCQAAGVPFLFKQWGDHAPHLKIGTGLLRSSPEAIAKIRAGEWIGECAEIMLRTPKKQAGRVLDGQEWNELPTQEGRAA